jgi:hypothetical protein
MAGVEAIGGTEIGAITADIGVDGTTVGAIGVTAITTVRVIGGAASTWGQCGTAIKPYEKGGALFRAPLCI